MALTAHGGQTDLRRHRRRDAGEAAPGHLSMRLPTHMVVRTLAAAGCAGYVAVIERKSLRFWLISS